MQYVAYVEVIGILGRLILGILIDALKNTTVQLDQWFIVPTSDTNNTALTVVSNVYISIKRLVSRYGGEVPLSDSRDK
ncbi:hypothetical protein MFLAVUS_006090 [Mucor flavus]|uniref:Uncharacterized protein n=1 Tax=Mucor flavus TaxID=439312 RepID=A0ABP9Z0J7_9FUNG